MQKDLIFMVSATDIIPMCWELVNDCQPVLINLVLLLNNVICISPMVFKSWIVYNHVFCLFADMHKEKTVWRKIYHIQIGYCCLAVCIADQCYPKAAYVFSMWSMIIVKSASFTVFQYFRGMNSKYSFQLTIVPTSDRWDHHPLHSILCCI